MTKATIKAMKSALKETIARCHNPQHPQYIYYGGRGITVCARWRNSFENFLADMGVRPEGLTLDRRDNDKGYEPGNCRWATRAEQTRNRRCAVLVEWQGRTQDLLSWGTELGIAPRTLHARLFKLGYEPELAFTKPVKCGAKVEGRLYPERRSIAPEKIRRGQDHANTRFSASEARQLRKAWLGGATFSALAREHNVTITPISSACQGLAAYKGIHDSST